jgi:hypothetical protein
VDAHLAKPPDYFWSRLTSQDRLPAHFVHWFAMLAVDDHALLAILENERAPDSSR